MSINNFIKKSSLVLATFVLILLITGCKSDSKEIDVTNMFTVVYDGNGGYLGNKTFTIRKLKAEAFSKIPKYTTDYTNDPYVVSSLGKAMRDGYTLKGWYLEENATYQENPNGKYIYLDLSNNNGIYSLDENGQYVLGYVENEQGEYIFIYVEEAPDDSDPTTLEYIYFDGGNGSGFYIYDPDNADHAAVYEEKGSYKLSDVSNYGSSYLIFADLSAKEKELFAELSRFNREFLPYNEGDEGLDRYALESGYAEIDAIMDANGNGKYVYVDGQYEIYDELNEDHVGKARFSINERYKFTPTSEVTSPSDLTRYEATITYWNFEKDRVTKDITLKAHWVKKITVKYLLNSQLFREMTTKPNANNTGSIDLVQGETIGKLETLPQLAGHTFVGWSKSETEYIPWNFTQDVFPTDSDTLTLYAYMIEGSYIRITSALDLAKVANDPTGNYILVNDIDLKGAKFLNKTPLGFTIPTIADAIKTPFTGKFIAFNHKITNFELQVKNQQKQIFADDGIEVISGLFPFVQNATIEGLVVDNAKVTIDTSISGTSVICDLGAAGIIGTAFEGTTTIKDCVVDITFVSSTSNTLDCTVYVGDFVAKGFENVVIIDSTSTIDYSNITNITSGTLVVHTQN